LSLSITDRGIGVFKNIYNYFHIDDFISLAVENSTIYPDINLPEAISSDPDDDKFIACALSADTNIIVSGDSDLLTVSGFQKIEVKKPKTFVDEYLST